MRFLEEWDDSEDFSFAEYVEAAELFEYSAEYFNLLKESSEIELIGMWLESNLFYDENMEYLEENFSDESINGLLFIEALDEYHPTGADRSAAQIKWEEEQANKGKGNSSKEDKGGSGRKEKSFMQKADIRGRAAWRSGKRLGRRALGKAEELAHYGAQKAGGIWDSIKRGLAKVWKALKAFFSRVINVFTNKSGETERLLAKATEKWKSYSAANKENYKAKKLGEAKIKRLQQQVDDFADQIIGLNDERDGYKIIAEKRSESYAMLRQLFPDAEAALGILTAYVGDKVTIMAPAEVDLFINQMDSIKTVIKNFKSDSTATTAKRIVAQFKDSKTKNIRMTLDKNFAKVALDSIKAAEEEANAAIAEIKAIGDQTDKRRGAWKNTKEISQFLEGLVSGSATAIKVLNKFVSDWSKADALLNSLSQACLVIDD